MLTGDIPLTLTDTPVNLEVVCTDATGATDMKPLAFIIKANAPPIFNPTSLVTTFETIAGTALTTIDLTPYWSDDNALTTDDLNCVATSTAPVPAYIQVDKAGSVLAPAVKQIIDTGGAGVGSLALDYL